MKILGHCTRWVLKIIVFKNLVQQYCLNALFFWYSDKSLIPLQKYPLSVYLKFGVGDPWAGQESDKDS